MLIDTCTYIGHWPFRKLPFETLQELCDHAEKHQVTHLFCTNVEAIFYKDAFVGNTDLLDQVKAYRGSVKVYPFAVVNPEYVCFEDDIKKYAALGFKGIELTPQYHGYKLGSENSAKAFKLCGELGLWVKVSAGFENIRQRNPVLDKFEEPGAEDIAKLLSASEKTTAVINAYFPTALGGSFKTEVDKRNNVFVDVMRTDSFVGKNFEAAINYLGYDRLVFASMCPFKYIEAQFVKLFVSKTADEDGVEKILYGNMKKALGI